MLNMHFFQNPRFSAASGAITLTFFTLFGTLFLMTQYLQVVLGFSALKAGLVLGPQAVMMLIFAPDCRRSGSASSATSSSWRRACRSSRCRCSDRAVSTSDTPTIAVIGATMVMGVGMANIMAPATDSIMGSLPRAKAGVGLGSQRHDASDRRRVRRRRARFAAGVALLGPRSPNPRRTAHCSPTSRTTSGAAHGYAVTHAQRPARTAAPRHRRVESRVHVRRSTSPPFVGVGVILLTALAVLRFLPARAPTRAAQASQTTLARLRMSAAETPTSSSNSPGSARQPCSAGSQN